MPSLICPVCGKRLERKSGSLVCEKGHSYDVAKEGYVNLLRSGRDGDGIGDDKISCRSRRDFLNKGYYSVLRDALKEEIGKRPVGSSVLDICCGEGYYTSSFAQGKYDVFGFDISKEAVRLASKRGNASYFVSNMTSIPFEDGSFDVATELFAPFCESEFARILKDGGSLFTVVPAAKHLWGLKTLLYDNPYENDEKLPETSLFEVKNLRTVTSTVTLETNEDIKAVFRMTPYFFRTSLSDKQKLETVPSLTTEIGFVIAEMVKK